jgi:hypothetical protein
VQVALLIALAVIKCLFLHFLVQVVGLYGKLTPEAAENFRGLGTSQAQMASVCEIYVHTSLVLNFKCQ